MSVLQKKPQTKKTFETSEKHKDVRMSNLINAKSVSDIVRTSLGPRGMDKMIQDGKGEVLVSNDGATILSKIKIVHPAGRMMVDLSNSQDVNAGDGTTTVVVICGSLLQAAIDLLDKEIHPMKISESFRKAEIEGQKYLKEMAKPVKLIDNDSLLKAAETSLSSKMVSQFSNIIGPIAVDAVMKITNPEVDTNVDLKNIRIIKKFGKTLEESKLVDGILFYQKIMHNAGGPSKIENAKIGLIQFQLSPPKTNMDMKLVITDYNKMDRMLRDERRYLIRMCKKIKDTGCNVLLIQKSILRDAVTNMALHILAKLKIMVIKDIERDEIEFISKTLNCKPIASIEGFVKEKLGSAGLVQEIGTSDGKLVQITDVPNKGKTVSVLIRGSNELLLDEAERSLHDALCVIRSLVKKKFLLPGGGAPEIEVSYRLREWAETLKGEEKMCVIKYAEALEIIPYTLSENAGLRSINVVTELYNEHKKGNKTMGLNVKKGAISDMWKDSVIQPFLVSSSALSLATELTGGVRYFTINFSLFIIIIIIFNQ
ncbi:t-complex protein 1 subunit delta [Anaeramoeba flamelloides]|nr:t-complex protein 1 subunit delta [Anaeramoeba flamelloides]